MVNKVYEFKDKKINEYLGELYVVTNRIENKHEKRIHVTVDKPINNQLTYNNQKKLKSLNNKLSKVESKIGVLENDIKDLDNRI